jgi:hypothetical protein
VLEPLFQGVLVFVSRPHHNHHSLSVRLGIPCRYGLALPVCTGSGHREIRFLLWVRAPGLDRFISTGAPANGVNPGW